MDLADVTAVVEQVIAFDSVGASLDETGWGSEDVSEVSEVAEALEKSTSISFDDMVSISPMPGV